MKGLSRYSAWAVALCPLFLGATCDGKQTAPARSVQPTVFLTTDQGNTVRVAVEVARTPEQRRLGLKHRSGLDKGKGMIFLFDRPEIQSFWMKDTMIPLDMIFIGPDMTVVGVVEDTVPMSLAPCRVQEPSQYVLEVEAGFTARHGIEAGARVEFEGFDYPGRE
jgi:hypothetical protein